MSGETQTMRGEIARAPLGREFFFVRCTDGHDAFCHMSGHSVLRGTHDGEPWLERSDSPLPPIRVGTKVVMKVVEGRSDGHTGRPSWRALMWALETAPMAFDYAGAVQGWRQFVHQSRDSNFVLAQERRTHAAQAARDYLSARYQELIERFTAQNPQMAHWRLMICEVLWVQSVSDRLDLGLNLSEQLEELQDAPKPPNPHDPLERLLMQMLVELAAGRPFSARKLLDDVRDTERTAVDRATEQWRSRQRSQSRGYGFGGGGFSHHDPFMLNSDRDDLQSRHAPVTTAFRMPDGEPAASFLDGRCFNELFRMGRELIKQIEAASFAGNHQEIPQIWKKAHAADPHLKVDSGLSDLIREACQVGAWELVDALAPLVRVDTRYERSRRELQHSLILPESRSKDPFARIDQMLREALETGYVEEPIKLFDKYVREQGREEAFLAGDSSRSQMLEDLAGLEPVMAVSRGLLGIYNFDSDHANSALDAAIALEQAATPAMRAHARWPSVLREIASACVHCGRHEEAAARLTTLATSHPSGVNGNGWKRVASYLYRGREPDRFGSSDWTGGWIDHLIRDGQFDRVFIVLNEAPEAFQEAENWSEIMEFAAKRLRNADQPMLAWQLIQNGCERDPDHEWNGIIATAIRNMLQHTHVLQPQIIMTAIKWAQEMRPEMDSELTSLLTHLENQQA